MTEAQIIELAREAGCTEMRENVLQIDSFPWGCEFEIDGLKRFATLVRSAALDEAAEKANSIGHGWSGQPAHVAFECAEAILALKGKRGI